MKCPLLRLSITDIRCRMKVKEEIKIWGSEEAALKINLHCPCELRADIPSVGTVTNSEVKEMNIFPVGEKEKVEGLIRQGFSIQKIVKETGVAKNTICHLRRLLVEDGEDIKCACGKAWGHKGWCDARKKARWGMNKTHESETPELKESIMMSETAQEEKPVGIDRELATIKEEVKSKYDLKIATLIASREMVLNLLDRLAGA